MKTRDFKLPSPPPRGVQVQNCRGAWVPAIPLPLYVGLKSQCDCGRKFWTKRGYQGHYALEHVMGLL